MKIVFLGWGSLIWDPRDLRVRKEWYSDGPFLPIEFARISGIKGLLLSYTQMLAKFKFFGLTQTSTA